jgi:hypothetical protein
MIPLLILIAKVVGVLATLVGVGLFMKYCEDCYRAWPTHSQEPPDPYIGGKDL